MVTLSFMVIALLRHFSFFVPLLTLFFLFGNGSNALAVDFRVLTESLGRPGEPIRSSSGDWALDVSREIMRRVGNKSKIEALPWARAYEIALHTPNVALVSTTRTQERDPLFHWVGPVLRLQWNFIARKKSGITIKSLDDARKVRAIGTYRNDARDKFLIDQGFTNLDRCVDSGTNYRKLAYGRVDLLVGTKLSRTKAIPPGLDPDSLEVVYTIKEVDIYLAISKRSDPETVKMWQAAFKAMQEDGTFARIFNKWFPGVKPPMDVRRPWVDDQ